MPDETLPGAANATPETPPQNAQPSQETNDSTKDLLGSVRPEDFNHPEFGLKIKNLHSGFQKQGEELGLTRKELATLKQQMAQMSAWLRDPRNAAVLRAYVDQLDPPKKPKGTENETDEERAAREKQETRDAIKAELLQELRMEGAITGTYHRLGNGDTAKGRAEYEKRGLDGYLKRLATNDPDEALRLAILLQEAEARAANPDVNGTTRTEHGRGQTSPPAPPRVIRSVEDMLKASGYASETEFLADRGAFGR